MDMRMADLFGNQKMSSIQFRASRNRMPVILAPDAGEAWWEEGGAGGLRVIEENFIFKASERVGAEA